MAFIGSNKVAYITIHGGFLSRVTRRVESHYSHQANQVRVKPINTTASHYCVSHCHTVVAKIIITMMFIYNVLPSPRKMGFGSRTCRKSHVHTLSINIELRVTNSFAIIQITAFLLFHKRAHPCREKHIHTRAQDIPLDKTSESVILKTFTVSYYKD